MRKIRTRITLNTDTFLAEIWTSISTQSSFCAGRNNGKSFMEWLTDATAVTLIPGRTNRGDE